MLSGVKTVKLSGRRILRPEFPGSALALTTHNSSTPLNNQPVRLLPGVLQVGGRGSSSVKFIYILLMFIRFFVCFIDKVVHLFKIVRLQNCLRYRESSNQVFLSSPCNFIY